MTPPPHAPNLPYMLDPEDNRRITLSRHTLARYVQAGGMGGKIEDNARMVREEVAILEALAVKYPSYTETLGKLVEDWQALVGKGMH